MVPGRGFLAGAGHTVAGPPRRLPWAGLALCPGLVALAVTAVLAGGCRRGPAASLATGAAPAPPSGDSGPRPAEARAGAGEGAPASAEASGIRPLRRCFPDLPAWVDPLVSDLLDRALHYQERDDFVGVLACAEEAARQAPRSVEAHHNRGLALMRLGRFDEARDALALALAISPDDGESLELAAELYINRLSPSAERTMVGLEFARRGRRSNAARQRARGARLALLEGQALVDLGRASEALVPLGVAERLLVGDTAARYELGVALFELCRFAAARRAFEGVLVHEPGHAHALYHLGLILERDGDELAARALFDRASTRDPKAFPPMPEVSPQEFANRVKAVVARLPAEVRADLELVPVETAEIPSAEDLTAERPPLSPTILGLYRGLPIGREAQGAPAADSAARALPASTAAPARGRQGHDPSAAMPLANASSADDLASAAVPARAIVLYRRNLLRSLHAPEELDRAIERTLLHEVGHLRGEDDGSLRDRGLE